MSHPTAPTVRLRVIWRPESPCAVILLKRGTQFCSFRWDLTTDAVEMGQWAKFKVYLGRCDISADGK